MQVPKVGRIVPPDGDVLQRLKAKLSFNAACENNLIFTSQKKSLIPRKMMNTLGGDTYFNRWQVPLISFARFRRCDATTHKNIFAGTADALLADPLSTTDTMSAEEAAMDDDARIPFPQEHDMMLGQEMIGVFDADVVIAFDVGSGELLKAVLMQKIFGIGI